MDELADALLDAWLREDAPFGDLTTRALGIGSRPARLRFSARAEIVVCAVEEAARLFRRCGADVTLRCASGDRLAPGEAALEAEGEAGALHLVWRTAQNLVEHASGIATATARLVAAARAVSPHIAVECTRKSQPGGRALAARAVRAGGGGMHRLGLSESILVFAEHTAFLGGREAVREALAALAQAHPGHKVTAEAHSAEEALWLARAGAHVIQLDKLPPEEVRRVVGEVQALAPAPAVVAAGGIDESNAGAYAATGCAALVTSAPLWARPAEIAVRIEPR